jgi:hypothetical protein
MNAAAGVVFDPHTVRSAWRKTDAAALAAQMYPASLEPPSQFPSVGARRRQRRSGNADPLAAVSLVLNEDGVLLWRAGWSAPVMRGRRQRRGVPPAPEGEVIELYQYEPLAPNEITEFLVKLDCQLNEHLDPMRNAAPSLVELRRDKKTGAVSRHAPANLSAVKPRLLFVHGTFSKTDAFIEGVSGAKGGPAFLEKIFSEYEVLAFDHATLSVGPILNAFDLARLLQPLNGPLDVIAHSRGGLVTRWALEGFGVGGAGPFRAVMVGAPIGGTSLASPPQLRSSLSLLSNIGTALQLAGSAASIYMPLLVAPMAILKIATSVVSLAAKTPLIDAAVQMIPGLAGQSRVGNSLELARIRSVALKTPPKYFVVQSDFETEAPGWKFWRWFNKGRLADAGADLIFPQKNDLVVDTASMTEFSGAVFPTAQIFDFPSNDKVHHCNYFAQDETLGFIRTSFGV